jgi:hypothetical protein
MWQVEFIAARSDCGDELGVGADDFRRQNDVPLMGQISAQFIGWVR